MRFARTRCIPTWPPGIEGKILTGLVVGMMFGPCGAQAEKSAGPLPAAAALQAGGGTPGTDVAQGNTQVTDTLELPQRDAHSPPPEPVAAKTVIVPSDVDRQMSDLADLLQRAAGLHVTRSGGVGDYVGVSVWGSSDRQVDVYVNGVLRNQSNDASSFLSSWDLSRVERIEVYKGLAPDHLPGSPMGGAINIVTRDAASPKGEPSARAAAGAGSFGSLRANGAVDYAGSGWRGHAEVARDQSDGDFTYYDDNGSEFQPGRHPDGAARLGAGDLVRKTRTNNAHNLDDAAADVSFAPAQDWRIGVRTDVSRLHKQVPSPFPDVDSSVRVNAFLESEQTLLHGYGRWASGDGDAEAALDVSGSYLGEVYVDTSKAGGAIGLGYNDDGNAYSDLLATLWGRKGVTGGLTLSSLVSYGVSGYRFTDRLRDRGYPLIDRYTGEGKFTPAFAFGRQSLEAVFAATVAMEDHNGATQYTYGGRVVPDVAWQRLWSLRLGWQFRFGDSLWIAAQAGNAYRIPTLVERYGDRGTILANPDLRPEAGFNGSLSGHARWKGIRLDADVFANEGRRVIELEQNSQFIMTYRNVNVTHVLGAETEAAWDPRPWSRTELAVTLQRAVDGAGYLLPYQPIAQGSLRQDFRAGRWDLAATGHYQGLAYPNASESASLFDSYSHNTQWQTRCDFDLSWRSRHWLAAAGVHNAFDQRNFDFFNYPLPGRHYAATLQAEL